ncbi:S1/P1 nuclease [Pseudohaliea rubra]|uniref:Endonuclease n=1 Tax=Pseudohaliea rubra DSM 19751 TaxID=1265313 RepID=A0A095VS43_9GAMM|nr:S1/P1 nuclease [Pseudohaliea rubra]KGE04277.1 Endonuclease [Pseudohaliea rubra DSM 19751]
MNRLRYTAGVILSLLALPALAWGPQGHRVAGAITEARLSPAATAAVRGILGDEPLAVASTWADRKRSDPVPFWQRQAGAWHYVNVPPGAARYDPRRAPAGGDAYTALAQFHRELADPATLPARRALALRFALHIIQDLHQPLHVGGRDDRGGNGFAVTVNGRRSNLHRLWDSGLLASARKSDGRLQARLEARYAAELDDAWREADPAVWIAESLALSRQSYPATQRIDPGYFERFRPAAERRVAQAGARGAAWLNALYREASEAPVTPASPAGWWQRLKDFLEEIRQRLV